MVPLSLGPRQSPAKVNYENATRRRECNHLPAASPWRLCSGYVFPLSSMSTAARSVRSIRCRSFRHPDDVM